MKFFAKLSVRAAAITALVLGSAAQPVLAQQSLPPGYKAEYKLSTV